MISNLKSGAYLASFAVILVAAGFLAYVETLRHGFSGETQSYCARFVSANGLHPGAKVLLSGVSVGRVQSVSLNPSTQMADVMFSLDKRISLPSDTSIQISAPSMTSDNVLDVVPGHATTFLPKGALLTDTHEQVSLEQEVSNYIFGSNLH